MDILDFKSASRCYFMDMGLANYYLTRTGTDSRVLAGTLNENYVYINLKKRQDFPPEISFETPAFATYRGGEIDFFGTKPIFFHPIFNRSKSRKRDCFHCPESSGSGKSR